MFLHTLNSHSYQFSSVSQNNDKTLNKLFFFFLRFLDKEMEFREGCKLLYAYLSA